MDWNTNFLQYKVVNSLEKVMPTKEPIETTLCKSIFRNERLNFQIALKSSYQGALGGIEIRAEGGLSEFVSIRKVDDVPVGFTITSVFLSTRGERYLNSDAISASTGIFENFSIIALPVSPAWYAVPQATIYIFLTVCKMFLQASSNKTAFSGIIRPDKQFLTAFGCA